MPVEGKAFRFTLLEEVAPLLVQCKCVGSQSAAQLMVAVGDNPERIGYKAPAQVMDAFFGRTRPVGTHVGQHGCKEKMAA